MISDSRSKTTTAPTERPENRHTYVRARSSWRLARCLQSKFAYRKHHASRPIIGIVEDNPYRSKSTVQRGGFCNLRGLSRRSAKNFPRMVKLNSWRGGTGQWITFASRPCEANLEWLEVLSDEDCPRGLHGTRRAYFSVNSMLWMGAT